MSLWLRSSQPTLASLWSNQPTRKFYCTHYTDIYGKHIQTAQNGKRATDSSKLEEQHPVSILCCTQSLFRLRSQSHFPPEANPPLSLRCPPHHGGFTPDAEAPRYATLRREAIVSASSLFSNTLSTTEISETAENPTNYLDSFSLITLDQLTKIISCSKPTTCILDPIPTKWLEEILPLINSTLLNTINLSLLWRSARHPSRQ